MNDDIYGILYFKALSGSRVPVDYLNEKECKDLLYQTKREQTIRFTEINGTYDKQASTYGRKLDVQYKQRTLYLLVKGTEFLVKGY